MSRPLGGWIVRARPPSARTVRREPRRRGLATAARLGRSSLGDGTAALVVGLAAGIPFAAAFTGAAARPPRSPDGCRVRQCVGGYRHPRLRPALGLTFGLPGDGRIGFLAVAVLWAAALLALPSERSSARPGRRSLTATSAGS